jgi:hypothetical protein
VITAILTGAATTAFGSVLTWCAAGVSNRRAAAAAARATTRVQADELIVAVAELRGRAKANIVLWGSWKETGRTFLMAVMAGAGGYARTAAVARQDDPQERDWSAIVAGLGSAVDVLGRDRRESKRADLTLTPAMVRVTAAAAPLLRHPDPRVAEATEQLLAVAFETKDTARVDVALREFGRAVVPATTVPPSRWRRLRTERSRAAIEGSGSSS